MKNIQKILHNRECIIHKVFSRAIAKQLLLFCTLIFLIRIRISSRSLVTPPKPMFTYSGSNGTRKSLVAIYAEMTCTAVVNIKTPQMGTFRD